jgi:hypothetical protein
MILGAGVPIRRSWSRMYSFSGSFTGRPVQVQLGRDVLDRRLPATSPDVEGKALGVERILGEEGQHLSLHGAAARAGHTANLQLQEHVAIAAREVSHPTSRPVVEPVAQPSARTAASFLDRRTRVTTRARGLPKMPTTLASGRNPGNRCASDSRFPARLLRIGKACQVFSGLQACIRPPLGAGFRALGARFRPTLFREDPEFRGPCTDILELPKTRQPAAGGWSAQRGLPTNPAES